MRQRCPIATCLFYIALEWVMRKTITAGRLKVGNKNLDCLVYANDVDPMAESKEEVGWKGAVFRRAGVRVGQEDNK